MDVKKWFDKLRTSSENEKYFIQPDFEGLNFTTTSTLSKAIKKGQAGGWITHQHIALTMLAEQGNAEVIPNGFIVPTEVVVNFDKSSCDSLGLPPRWDRKIDADIKGNTGNSNFGVDLSVETPDGRFTRIYKVIGPVLKFSEDRQYLLSTAQQTIFGAHQAHGEIEKNEYDNLRLLFALQKGQELGAQLNLKHFNKLDIKAPESITIEAELDEDGNLILTPYMGQEASSERVNRVLGQLQADKATALRVDDEIILFDDQKLKAVHEILENRTIPKSKVQEFLKAPTAFIDASLVDLDLGFSARVKGATIFKHAYFGETDGTGIDWFGRSFSAGEIASFNKLGDQIEDKETLEQLKLLVEDAQKTGAHEIDFQGKTYDISTPDAVLKTLERIDQKINKSGDSSDTSPSDEYDDDQEDTDDSVAVVDIDLNDEDLELSSPMVDKAIDEILFPAENLNWDNYARTPYPHQEIGVQWIVGLSKSSDGGLLADDMGLGKTFMALSAIDQIYKLNSESNLTKKPALIVAPLSLLEIWKDEVDKTFNSSPFKSIIILQASADLKRYRSGGIEIRNQTSLDDGQDGIKYSLKIGKHFGAERLDLPERLVITTYQTLRDYQFSLCQIDWGMVVFDEAQNTKNPNALQTRAAKGLKAGFKLVATGTPVENSLADFWCLMDTACPGHLNKYQLFRERYVTPIVRAASDEIEEIRGRVGRELRIKVGPLMLRRLKEDNLEGLPEKKIYVGIEDPDWLFLNSLKKIMSGDQLSAYNATLDSRVNAERNEVLGALQKLRDISLHPRLADKGQIESPNKKRQLRSLFDESAKMQSLIEILEQIKKRKEKCIIFTVNKRLQQFLSQALGAWFGLGPLSIINGDAKAVAKRASVPTRKSMISDFEAVEGFNIIVMSPVAAGVGLTVVGANNVIHFERHWNPAKEAQATDRVYRIGQEKDVSIYVPVLHHPKFESFDVNLHSLLSQKTSLKDAVVTPEQVIPNPSGFDMKSFTPDHQITSDDLHKISWEQFEALCCLIIAKDSNPDDKWLTKSGADYGADAVVVGDPNYLIQCKHKNVKNTIYDGYKAILEVQAAKIKYENALDRSFSKLLFMTNALKLSGRTRKTAQEYNVEIMGQKELKQLLVTHPISIRDVYAFMNKKRLAI
ncbi:MAG: restriction endonuclease [Desulfobacula sp.]|uniref:SNF2-related protein n=1 Tax=Desulfobacula sp. TaxID=2593537 RepID=UPI0025C3DE41|nr:SNF2-related protein [Desulfobacula sp.]MCD4722467.1 restriction endonuclease [Desulfobacula sp.]